MRIGLINELHGGPDTDQAPPSWESIRNRAEAAETVGFDMFVFEDALMYRGAKSTMGVWESMSVAAALAVATSHIGLGQSVVNSPYRSPAMVAKTAETLDEISGGRYVLGVGAGNTPDSDYEAFGFPTDFRYSRFEEALQIIHTLLKTGVCDFEGSFYTVKRAELVLRGPSSDGPKINVAAGGPKMIRLAAEYGDAWNWWGHNETTEQINDRIAPLLKQLDDAAEAAGRDPDSIERTLDFYTVVPEGHSIDGVAMDQPLRGTSGQIAEHLLELGELGLAEIRCDLHPKTMQAIESMEEVVQLVHQA